ncbi:ABC transporter ATP-binding protein [Nocardioides sp. SYSU D00038]|uniref:energy-coupling factor ABC transporter ATP-binding protein n=1 Tax=Nocardioides sp. SYSU D00038 TaxID=2812554 RepID=UPI0027DD14A0|nr:ABC transporter ATP-binding protein [Nocardioides sp. SYSU D00038]
MAPATISLDGAGVTVETDDGHRVLLEPTTLRLTERRIGVIGANGSGKSTLVRLLNGLVAPTTGRVEVHGVDVGRDPRAARRVVGFAFTDPSAQLVMPTCVEDVELSLRRHVRAGAERRVRALEVLDRFGLADHAHDSVHSLSGGQRQLLALAGVLAIEPALLVADEPTTLLDLANTRRVADVLFGLDQQLVLVTHDLELAARCERVVVVDAARVAYDGPGEAAVAHYRDAVSA